MTEAVQEILNAEKQAEQATQRAEREKAKLIARAREQAVERLSSMKKDIEQRSDRDTREQLQKLEQERQRILARYGQDAARLTQQGERNLGKAAALLIRKLRAGEGFS